MTVLGFFLSGFLLGFLGAALPGWGYHVAYHYSQAGWLFLAVSVGVLSAGELYNRVFPSAPARSVRFTACFLAAVPLLLFGFLHPPVRFEGQLVLWLALGFSAGLLNASLFESVAEPYRSNPAGTIATAGMYFVSGCFTAAVAVAVAFRFGFVSQTPPALALVPALFGLSYLRSKIPLAPLSVAPSLAPRHALREFSKPGALLFTLLLLFQSGSEWTVAGWLPVFLTHRLGISPETAIWMLALYWIIILAGRAASGFFLVQIPHSRFLFASASSALLGCFLLVSTDNSLGAIFAIAFLGCGFSGIYPFLAQKVGSRFPDYHPAMFNHIFSIVLSGGLLSPWLAGLLADPWGLTVVVALPAAATVLVLSLLLVVWLESKVTGR